MSKPETTLKAARRLPAFRWLSLSLRARLLLFLLTVTMLSFLLVAFLALDSVNQLGGRAQDIAGQAVTNQVKADLVQYNTAISRENDRFFAQILSEAQVLATFIRSAYEHDHALTITNGSLPPDLQQLPQGQFANSPDAVSSVYLPNFALINDQTLRDLGSSAELDEIFPSIKKQFPAIVALFFSTPGEMTRYYPNINLGQVLPENWQVTSRPWYQQAVQKSMTSFWVDPYLDATGLGLVSTAAVPVYADAPDPACQDCPAEGTLLGVIGVDVLLSEVTQSVQSNNLLPEASYSFIVDSSGRGVSLPDQAYLDLLGRPPARDERLTDLLGPEAQALLTPEFKPILTAMKDGKTEVVEVILPGAGSGAPGRKVLVAYAPLKSPGWSLGTVIEEKVILAPIEVLRSDLASSLRAIALQRFLPSVLFLVLAVFAAIFWLSDRWVRPIRALAEASAQIGAGKWSDGQESDGLAADADTGQLPGSTDELQMLTQSFNTMKKQVYASLSTLEERVAERTGQLERRQLELQTAADLARDITQTVVRQPGQFDAFLIRAVDLISQRFGFYYAGLFLVDAHGEYAVLQAGSGEAGRKLAARGHRLRIGRRAASAQPAAAGAAPVGIVGTVAGTGSPRIALDTDQDVVHFKNPLLPETRSEMALPLKSAEGFAGGAVIGVLDVQSTEPNAFDDQDIAILQILTDQLAVAIQNARLFRSYQTSLQELENLTRQLTSDTWKKVAEGAEVQGFELLNGVVSPLAAAGAPETGPHLLPVVVRGETVARMEIWPAEGGLTAADQRLLNALADRLSQAFEAARLFEEAQARSFREQAINEFVTELSQSSDLQTLLKSAARQLGALPNIAEVTIEMAVPAAAAAGTPEARREPQA